MAQSHLSDYPAYSFLWQRFQSYICPGRFDLAICVFVSALLRRPGCLSLSIHRQFLPDD
ncbi:hypothetical protein BMETH_1093_2 [methanotrophic bacterial endosymbiont of Bathymodiolus sp.]|nr:hypothetical protein BMETH_1093_2 [methanotrophic bacterial endosymbiont of Bathymodiolus sp.]